MKVNYPYLKIITRRSRSKKSKKIIKKDYYYFRDKKYHARISVSPDHPQFHKMYTAIDSSFADATTHGTIGWACDWYLKSKHHNSLSKNSQRDDRKFCKALKEVMGEYKLNLITAVDVRDFKEDYAEVKSNDAANKILSFMRKLFNQAEIREMQPINPFAKYGKLETPPRDQRWEDDEIALVHKYKDDLHPNNYLVFLMGLYTLQRIGDILDLDRDQYDGEKISLRQAKTLKKSRKLVGFPVHKDLKIVLDKSLIGHNHHKLLQQNSYWSFRKDFGNFRRKHNLTHKRFHDLRRTGMVKMAELGVNDIMISAVSGHSLESTKRILETYLPRNYKMAKKAMETWESGTL